MRIFCVVGCETQFVPRNGKKANINHPMRQAYKFTASDSFTE